MNNNKNLNKILRAYLIFMTSITALLTTVMFKTLIINEVNKSGAVYLSQIAELIMTAVLFLLFAYTLVLNLTKKYHKKTVLFAIRLFTIFIMLDMIIYILVFDTINNDIILYIAFIYITFALLSYVMDVIVRKMFDDK